MSPKLPLLTPCLSLVLGKGSEPTPLHSCSPTADLNFGSNFAIVACCGKGELSHFSLLCSVDKFENQFQFSFSDGLKQDLRVGEACAARRLQPSGNQLGPDLAPDQSNPELLGSVFCSSWIWEEGTWCPSFPRTKPAEGPWPSAGIRRLQKETSGEGKIQAEGVGVRWYFSLCTSRYKLVGQSHRRCETLGRDVAWSGLPPICQSRSPPDQGQNCHIKSLKLISISFK